MKTILLLLLNLTLAGTAMHGLAQPVITQQPRNQTNIAGTTATFTVEATGTPPLTYQWRHHLNGSTATNIPGATEAILLLPNVQATGRRYCVVVTDDGGLSVTSSLAILTVLTLPTLPTIIDPPLTQFAWAGQPVTLKISFTNGTAPISYQWQWNGVDLTQGTNRNLSLSPVKLTNTGNYRVILSNSAGAITSAVARLTVRDMPLPTGVSFVNITNLENSLQLFMRTRVAPGASLAIMKDGRLLAARGYGYSDPENSEERVQPDARFALGSLSKAITATAILKLVEQGRLNLDDKVIPLLKLDPPNFPGMVTDPRITNITVRHLLNHTAGWDRDSGRNPAGGTGFDPMFWFNRPAADMGATGRLTARDMVRWITGFPLQYVPGSTYRYSNNGYIMAGVLVEELTGLPYEEAVRSLLATPGITRLRIPDTSPNGRKPDEVVRWLSPLLDMRAENRVEIPGTITQEILRGWPLEQAAGAAGWVCSSLDYAHFIATIDAQAGVPDLLSETSVRTMLNPSPQSIAAGNPYGMGWYVDNSTGEISHSGAIYAGTICLALRRSDGVVGLVFFSTFNWGFYSDLYGALSSGLASITAWPTNDFFATTLSYDAWRDRHFTVAELADATLSGPDANPDGDDSVNLLEYATGTDPKTDDDHHAPTGSFVTVEGQTYFALTFRRLLLGYELNYVAEASDDLATWSPLTEPVGPPQLNPDGTHTVTIRDSAPANTTSHRYLRLRVARQ